MPVTKKKRNRLIECELTASTNINKIKVITRNKTKGIDNIRAYINPVAINPIAKKIIFT